MSDEVAKRGAGEVESIKKAVKAVWKDLPQS